MRYLYGPWPLVRCARCGQKTSGRLYRAKHFAANVCSECRRHLKDYGFTVIRMRCLAAFLLLAAAVPARADKKPWYKNPEWFARKAVIGAALAADGLTTCQAYARGAVESGVIGGGGHSCRLAGFQMGAAFAYYNVLDYASVRFLRDDPSPKWRFASRWSIPAVVGIIHGLAAKHNAGVN